MKLSTSCLLISACATFNVLTTIASANTIIITRPAFVRVHRDVTVNSTPAYQPITITEHSTDGLSWINRTTGKSIPSDAVVGGVQNNPYSILYVCRVNYRGGVHPGKLVDGKCNIGWGGDELEFTRYQVLTTKKTVAWVETTGFIPARAIPGGYENDEPIYICQAHYQNGMHPGKVIDKKCNIGWNGAEIVLSNYNILVG